MVSDSNNFVLIRSEGRGSDGKQLVLHTSSTYQVFGEGTKLITLRLAIKMMRLYSDHQVLCDRQDATRKHQ